MNAVEALARAHHARQHPTFEFDPVNRENSGDLRECYCMAIGDELQKTLGDLRFRIVPVEVLHDPREGEIRSA